MLGVLNLSLTHVLSLISFHSFVPHFFHLPNYCTARVDVLTDSKKVKMKHFLFFLAFCTLLIGQRHNNTFGISWNLHIKLDTQGFTIE